MKSHILEFERSTSGSVHVSHESLYVYFVHTCVFGEGIGVCMSRSLSGQETRMFQGEDDRR